MFASSGCGVRFTFNTDGVNADNTPIPLTYTFSKDIASEYGAIINVSSASGTTIVEVSNLPQGANFSINISGTQSLPLDAYRYIDSQDLVGLFEQTNYMSAWGDYSCIGNCDFGLLDLSKSVIAMLKSISLLEITLQSNLVLFDNCQCDSQALNSTFKKS